MNKYSFVVLILPVILLVTPTFAQSDPSRVISFGTTLDPQAVITSARQLAKSL